MSRCFQKSKGALPRQQLMYMAIFYNRHLAVDCKTGEIVFETQFSKYANKTCAESFVYFKQIIKLIRSLFLLKCSNYRDTVMEDNGYSVKDRGFIFNIVYRSLLFRSSFCFIFLLSRGDDVDDGCCPKICQWNKNGTCRQWVCLPLINIHLFQLRLLRRRMIHDAWSMFHSLHCIVVDLFVGGREV